MKNCERCQASRRAIVAACACESWFADAVLILLTFNFEIEDICRKLGTGIGRRENAASDGVEMLKL